MLGAIAGDIIGSVYEWNNVKKEDFTLFTTRSHYTDDTVLTVAVADALLSDGNYKSKIHQYGNKFRDRGYGGAFRAWLSLPITQAEPYNSWGNGSAMRVASIGLFGFKRQRDVLSYARKTALPTHNHKEGIKGARAIALATHLAKKGYTKEKIKSRIEALFNYDLSGEVGKIRKTYKFDVSCQGSVPQAIIAFLEGNSFEDVIRKAISLGGDSDTIAAMAGTIAEAYYGIPNNIALIVQSYLPYSFKNVLIKFYDKIYYDMKIPTKVFHGGKILEELTFPPINCELYKPYFRGGKKYIITNVEIFLENPQKPKWEVTVVLESEFKGKRKDIAKEEGIKTVSKKEPKKYVTSIPNSTRYLIQKREKTTATQMKWGNWLNFKEFEKKEERDEDLKQYLKEQTPFLQYKAIEKFQKGVNLSPEQKVEKNKGEGKFVILCKEFDSNTKKLSGEKIYKKFKTIEERQKYYSDMTPEEKKGRLFKFATK